MLPRHLPAMALTEGIGCCGGSNAQPHPAGTLTPNGTTASSASQWRLVKVRQPSAGFALPEDEADEERPEALDVLRGLRRLAHGLDEVRERMQIAADEPDDEVVVVSVEPVAGETDVVGEVGVAIGAAEGRVLPEDRALLRRREPRECADPAQRVP